MKLHKLVDEAIEVLEHDLACELRKAEAHQCKHGQDWDCMIHEIRETCDALEDCICIKHYMGWLKKDHTCPPVGNPY